MKLFVTFKMQNPDYNKEYANEYNQGRESGNNPKDLFSDGHRLVDEVDSISVVKDTDYNLIGLAGNGIKISVILPHMTVLKVYRDNKIITEYAVSNELVKRTLPSENKKYNTTRFYFYLQPREDFVQLSERIYLLKKDLPNELKL